MCGICVEELDHHCIFFGKCIAKSNLDSFHCSIALFMASSVYFMILMFLNNLWMYHPEDEMEDKIGVQSVNETVGGD